VGGVGNDELNGGDGNDYLAGDQVGGADTGAFGDTINGANGNDTVEAGNAPTARWEATATTRCWATTADTMDGGNGNDTFSAGQRLRLADRRAGNDLLGGGLNSGPRSMVVWATTW